MFRVFVVLEVIGKPNEFSFDYGTTNYGIIFLFSKSHKTFLKKISYTICVIYAIVNHSIVVGV